MVSNERVLNDLDRDAHPAYFFLSPNEEQNKTAPLEMLASEPFRRFNMALMCGPEVPMSVMDIREKYRELFTESPLPWYMEQPEPFVVDDKVNPGWFAIAPPVSYLVFTDWYTQHYAATSAGLSVPNA